MNLYELPAAYAAWEHAVDQAGGEVTPELEDELVAIEDSLAAKVDAVCALIRTAEVESAAIRAEAARMANRARACDRRAERLRELLLEALKASHVDTMKTDRFRLSVRRSSLPTIRWAGAPEDMPDWCTRVKKEYDPQLLLKWWKAEGAVPEGFSVTFADVLQIR